MVFYVKESYFLMNREISYAKYWTTSEHITIITSTFHKHCKTKKAST